MENSTRSQQEREENISLTNELSNTPAVQTGTGMPPLTPKPNTTINIISTPTTYNPSTVIETDVSNFKQVVQYFTCMPKTGASSSNNAGESSNQQQQQQGMRIYERRNHHSNRPLTLNPVAPGFAGSSSSSSPGYGGLSPHQIISPSALEFHQLALSPAARVSPFNGSSSSSSSSLQVNHEEEERKAIAEKRFYLHPSPRRSGEPPQLLQLFPLTSPKFDNNANRD